MFSHEKITKDISRAKKFFEDLVSYTVGPYTLEKVIKTELDKINIVDVRDYESYSDGHIPYAIHIPYEAVEEHLDLLHKEKITIIYTYNDTCPRAYKTALKILDKNYPAVTLRGGFKKWKKFDFEVIKTD